VRVVVKRNAAMLTDYTLLSEIYVCVFFVGFHSAESFVGWGHFLLTFRYRNCYVIDMLLCYREIRQRKLVTVPQIGETSQA
jgi:hypothetical protein